MRISAGNSAQPCRASRRRHLAAASAALLLPALSACSAGTHAQTNLPYQPAEGVNNRDGDVYALNTLIVTDGQGAGTLVASLVNNTDTADTVRGVSVLDSASAQMQVDMLGGGVDIPPHGAVQLATAGSVRVSSDTLQAGRIVALTLTFDNAGDVDLEVPVVNVGTIYTGVPVGPVATPGSEDVPQPASSTTS